MAAALPRQPHPFHPFRYTRDVALVLITHLGGYPLADLDASILRTVFAKIAAITDSKGLPQAASAMQHLPTTLRAALNLAVKDCILDCNPARHIEIHGYQQPHAKVWTEARVASWEQTGAHPAVAASGPPTSSPSSSPPSPTTPCTRSGGSPVYAGCAAANCAGCAGPTSTSTGLCSPSNATAPPPATRSSRTTPRLPPDAAPSPWTSTLSGSCGRTAAGSRTSAATPSPTVSGGPAPDTYSSAASTHVTPTVHKGRTDEGPEPRFRSSDL